MHLKLLAAATLLSVAACDGAPGPGSPHLTEQTKASGLPLTFEQKAVVFRHADLAVEVDPARHAITGVATLRFTAKSPLSNIQLDLDPNLPIASIAVDGRELASGAWSNPLGRLAVRLPAPVAAGRDFVLRITYGGQPHVAVRAPWDGGFVWAKTADGKPWIATAVQGEGCDLFWPCIDNALGEPELVDLHITVPNDLAAPANGRLIGIRDAGRGRRTFDWRAKNPNTYAIALNVGPYELIQARYRSRFGNTIPLQFWHLKGRRAQAEKLFAEFAPTLDFYEATVGPYPFGDEKLGLVETPHLGMEHQTINAYGNEYAKDITGYDWLFHHELSHEWFGNQLTNADSDDMWLHEGYGSYMQPLYGGWRGGPYEFHGEMREFTKRFLNEHPISTGRSRTEKQVYDATTGPGIDIYQKAAWVLHTLRGLIGDDAFFEVTRRAVYGRPDPRPGNFRPHHLSTAQYVAIASQVAGHDLNWFFDVYLRSAKLPDLVTSRIGNRLFLVWRTPGGKPFPMPIEVQVGDAVTTLAMAGGKDSVVVQPGARIVIDPAGKVLRRSLDQEAWKTWKTAEDAKKKT